MFGDTLFSELVAAGSYSENVFGMCLAATEGVASNGTINFGGIDESLYTGEIQWTSVQLHATTSDLTINEHLLTVMFSLCLLSL